MLRNRILLLLLTLQIVAAFVHGVSTGLGSSSIPNTLKSASKFRGTVPRVLISGTKRVLRSRPNFLDKHQPLGSGSRRESVRAAASIRKTPPSYNFYLDDDWYASRLDEIQKMAIKSYNFASDYYHPRRQIGSSSSNSDACFSWQTRLFNRKLGASYVIHFSAYKLRRENTMMIIATQTQNAKKLKNDLFRDATYIQVGTDVEPSRVETVAVDVYAPEIYRVVHVDESNANYKAAFLEIGQRAHFILNNPEVDKKTKIVVLGSTNILPINEAVYSLSTELFVQDYQNFISTSLKKSVTFPKLSNKETFKPRIYPFVIQNSNLKSIMGEARAFTIPSVRFCKAPKTSLSYFIIKPEASRTANEAVKTRMCKTLYQTSQRLLKGSKDASDSSNPGRGQFGIPLADRMRIANWMVKVFDSCTTSNSADFHKFLMQDGMTPVLEELDVIFGLGTPEAEDARNNALALWKPTLQLSFTKDEPRLPKKPIYDDIFSREYEATMDHYYGGSTYFDNVNPSTELTDAVTDGHKTSSEKPALLSGSQSDASKSSLNLADSTPSSSDPPGSDLEKGYEADSESDDGEPFIDGEYFGTQSDGIDRNSGKGVGN